MLFTGKAGADFGRLWGLVDGNGRHSKSIVKTKMDRDGRSYGVVFTVLEEMAGQVV